ncbi:MAG: hypothetical protein EOO04_25920 [Chitinophagaceae bacterium]|nr:MAG: hypothetical protein EOO04_25920 [Chitinophagaceae bacterium]
MTKYPFTQAGCLELQEELYELTNVELGAEADSLRENFTFWVEAHFVLAPSQVAYLNSLNSHLIEFMAYNGALAIANRLPINLVKPTSRSAAGDPEPDPEDDEKLIRPKSRIASTGNNQGGYEITGDLEIEILYLV